MSRLRLREHNQGDVAVEDDQGYDVACLSERSPHPVPGRLERYVGKDPLTFKGLAIDWDPDVFDVHHKGAHLAHMGIPRRSPRRGTLVLRGRLVENGAKVAVIASHRINDPDGSTRAFPRLVRRFWDRHAALDARLAQRALDDGYAVVFGSDINDHRAALTPLTRADRTLGHYDAIGYAGARLVSCVAGSTGGSDHARFTATFEI